MRNYGNVGGAPFEYVQPTDFDATQDMVIIYDQFKGCLLYYALDGSFMKAKKVPFIANGFKYLSDNSYIFNVTGNHNYHLPEAILTSTVLQTDSNFVIQKRGGFWHHKNSAIWNDIYLAEYHQNICFQLPQSDTLFEIDARGDLNTACIFDYGGKKMPTSFRELQQQDFSKKYSESGFAFPGYTIAMDNFIYFTFSMSGVLHYGWFCKSTGNVIYGDSSFDDIDPIFYSRYMLQYYKNNIIAGVCYAHDVHDRFLKDENKSILRETYGEKTYGLLTGLTPEDNPFIILYHLKEF